MRVFKHTRKEILNLARVLEIAFKSLYCLLTGHAIIEMMDEAFIKQFCQKDAYNNKFNWFNASKTSPRLAASVIFPLYLIALPLFIIAMPIDFVLDVVKLAVQAVSSICAGVMGLFSSKPEALGLGENANIKKDMSNDLDNDLNIDALNIDNNSLDKNETENEVFQNANLFVPGYEGNLDNTILLNGLFKKEENNSDNIDNNIHTHRKVNSSVT